MSYEQLIAYIDGLYADMELSEQDYVDIINYIISNGNPLSDPRDLIQIRRGNEIDLPNLAQAEMALTLDTENMFIGGLAGNVQLAMYKDLNKFSPKNVKDYGSVGDGTLHTITEILPSVTLAEVQALNPTATLLNSVDWYALQTAINENSSTEVIGDLIIDLPIKITANTKAIYSKPQFSTIKNVGTGVAFEIGTDIAIAFTTKMFNLEIWGTRTVSSHGIHFIGSSMCTMVNCLVREHGGNGLHASENDKCYSLRLVNCKIDLNKDNAGLFEHRFANQKNAISFFDCRISNNGYDANDDSYYTLGQPTDTTGNGIVFSGTALSINGGCVFEGNSGYGVRLGGVNSEETLNGISIQGNYFEPNLMGDMYVGNALNIFDGIINGNYTGSNSGNSETGDIYVEDYAKVTFNSVIQKYIVFNDNKMLFSPKFNDITRFKTSSDYEPLASQPSKYEVIIDYDWNKISGGSTVKFGLFGIDYDGNFITTSTTQPYQEVPLATVIQNVLPTDTVIYFDDITGWDSAGYSLLTIFDTILNNGEPVGTDFTHNTILSTQVALIDEVLNRIVLNSPIGVSVESGTECCLNSSSGIGSYIVATRTLDENENTFRWIYDVSGKPYIYYLQPEIVLASAVSDDDNFKIKRISVDKAPLVLTASTASRPVLTVLDSSYQYFDTTIDKPIWWTGSDWVDATGTSV